MWSSTVLIPLDLMSFTERWLKIERTKPNQESTNSAVNFSKQQRQNSIKQQLKGFFNNSHYSYRRSNVVYCPKCNQRYSSPAHLKRHLKYECGLEAQFSCPYCFYRAKRKDNLHAHIARKHSKERSSSRNEFTRMENLYYKLKPKTAVPY
ncbi:hypothetical protein RUM44_009531 [Polyplax serrata]|uniref:C2H2-type domain-containing protein n=1 Tax=Polyplax serrata TaxID=468196 RepID=A0ABR1ASZ5_POLSC